MPLLCCRYGAHLSKEEVAKLVAPHPDTLELVNSWLEHHGVPSSSISTTHGGSWLTVTDVPVSQANKLPGASYQLYPQAGTNDTAILRTVGYGLPTVLHTRANGGADDVLRLHAHHDAAANITRAFRRSNGAAGESGTGEFVTVLSSTDDLITPSHLSWLYKTFAYTHAATDRNALGIVGY